MPDRAQRKLTADFLEKFSLALATAIAAKIFFSEDGLSALTAFAAVIMLISFFASYLIVYGTEEKQQQPRQAVEGRKMNRKRR